jgi:hypothetical protein
MEETASSVTVSPTKRAKPNPVEPPIEKAFGRMTSGFTPEAQVETLAPAAAKKKKKKQKKVGIQVSALR